MHKSVGDCARRLKLVDQLKVRRHLAHDRLDGFDHVRLIGKAEFDGHSGRRLAPFQSPHRLLRAPDHLKILPRDAGGALEMLLGRALGCGLGTVRKRPRDQIIRFQQPRLDYLVNQVLGVLEGRQR